MNKIELLQSVSIFWDLNDDELKIISEKMVQKVFSSGEMILLEESEGEQCFFVTKG